MTRENAELVKTITEFLLNEFKNKKHISGERIAVLSKLIHALCVLTNS